MKSTSRLSKKNQPVLVVDDSAYARRRFRRQLADEGMTDVIEANDGDEGLKLFAEHRPHLVILDQVMRGKEGIETAQLMLEQDPSVCIVMMTGLSDPALPERAREVGIHTVLSKTDWESLREILAKR